MIRVYRALFLLLATSAGVMANNVKVSNVQWPKGVVPETNIIQMTCTVEWENSWRDAYNYDAVYLFFKLKKKEENSLKSTEIWHHLYLLDDGCKVKENGAESDRFGYWLSPLAAEGNDCNTGVYLFRKNNGRGNNSMEVTVCWNITKQKRELVGLDIEDNKVLISAQAIEMVYIPGGPFRVGDGSSDSTFRLGYSPIPEKYDLVTTDATFQTNAESQGPEHAADHLNDNTSSTQSMWVGKGSTPFWIIDFGAGNEKTIRYFGVNSAKAAAGLTPGIPTEFQLDYEKTPNNSDWTNIWKGSGTGNWLMAEDAYPIQKAIKVDSEGAHQRYRIRVNGMQSGTPVVTSISMAEADIETINDYSVLIDGTVTERDSVFALGARDGMQWTETLPETYPNGFRDFYAMKYELTQEQYVGFMNKLTFSQQNNLLNEKLTEMKEGQYIFGNGEAPACRNGVVLSTRIEDTPAIFANNLTPADSIGKDTDGKEVACNYMCVTDMLAYADWAGLRPLTELEYEKMARPLYPYRPQNGEYAWNTTDITPATGALAAPGTPQERPQQGNANYGNNQTGPIRAGSFAGGASSRLQAGASYWGVMELCGNAAEIYYNANNKDGIVLLLPETVSGNKFMTAHGDGYLGADGYYNGSDAGKKWDESSNSFILRGGAFSSRAENLAVSDRSTLGTGVVAINLRDSSVTFRLGRSLPEKPALVSVLTLENGASTGGVKNVADTVYCDQADYYIIRGNAPVSERRVHSYLWKVQVAGGRWHVLEGEHSRDLIFRGFKKDISTDQIYRFMRIVTTPGSNSVKSSAFYGQVLFKGKVSE